MTNAVVLIEAGPRVLAGHIRRGQTDAMTAVLWSSDLRAFTARSDRLPGQRMIAILDALFDVQARAIAAQGGEILKFIGDGLLAIFPIIDAGFAGIANGFTSSGENRQNALRSYFQTFLHRTVSNTDLVGLVNSGLDLLTLEATVLSSPEFFTNG